LSALLTQYCSGDTIEEVGGPCSTYGESRSVYRVLMRKPKGKRPLRRPRLIWEDNIKMDLQEVDVEAWTGSSWLRTGAGGGQLWMR